MRDFQKGGRSAVFAEKGMAATAHPTASLIAVDVLRAGGNAIDAAVAATAYLCVVEPAMTALGSDCFALISKAANAPIGINGSGKAGASASAEVMRQAGHTTMPLDHGAAITTPGAIAAWAHMLETQGTLSFGDVLQPALKAAREGFIVTPRIAFDWAENVGKLKAHKGTAKHYLLNGDAPKTGDLMKLPALAETIETLCKEGAKAFYTGPIAAEMAQTAREMGGFLSEADLAAVKTDDMPPISASYRGQELVELPPNTQGVMAQLTLKILEGFDLASLDPMGAKRLHLEMEAARLAYACRDAVIADPDYAKGVAEALLAPGFVDKMRARINPNKAGQIVANISPFTDTTYVSVIDENRNAVSLINSVFRSFGSGYTTEKTGILLQNRGGGFSLEKGHPNELAPNKRPMHTLLPGMLMQGGKLALSFGVMGGQYQACGHVRFLTNLYDYGMDLQEAMDAPRAFWSGLRASEFSTITLERGYGETVASELQAMGHSVSWIKEPIGGSQAVQIDHERGILIGASDPRKDGCALGY